MSEAAGSGWDDLQYPYGLLNIKGGEMPSYPKFVRGNLSLGNAASPCYASLNMTSEITPFFNSRLEVMNVKKFIEDGGITVLDPGKTYVIKMPKLVKRTLDEIKTVRYPDCGWQVKGEVFYEYTYFIRPLNKTRMSLNQEQCNTTIQEWWPDDASMNTFTVTRFQTFSSGNTLDTIMSADPQGYCYIKSVSKIQNIRKSDIIIEYSNYIGGNTSVTHKNIADFFLVKETYYFNGFHTDYQCNFIDTPLKIFTEGAAVELNLLSSESSYERKLTPGCCQLAYITNTTDRDPKIKNKTRLPHTLTMIARNEKENIPKSMKQGNPIQTLFNSMFKFENVDDYTIDKRLGLVIIPLLNITY